MTDLEITRLCAEAMGLRMHSPVTGEDWNKDGKLPLYVEGSQAMRYDPIHNDAQAMALVKKFKPQIEFLEDGRTKMWLPQARTKEMNYQPPVVASDFNRAICECLAKMQQAKAGA